MAVSLFTLALSMGAFLVIWIVLDLLAPRLLWSLSWLLPNDICGPGDWYLDTTEGRGIFDPRPRCNRA